MIKKLANLPLSKLPTLSYTPSISAGVLVRASIILLSESPYSLAFCKLRANWLTLDKSAVVNAKGIPAFSKAAG